MYVFAKLLCLEFVFKLFNIHSHALHSLIVNHFSPIFIPLYFVNQTYILIKDIFTYFYPYLHQTIPIFITHGQRPTKKNTKDQQKSSLNGCT